jgi:hypothetical protein
MAKAVIAPFPADIDRNAFGHWLSGFVDGEAHFGLRVDVQAQRKYGTPKVWFRINLRDDDTEVLRIIQSFWNCGRLTFGNLNPKNPNQKPFAFYDVYNCDDVCEILIPHFVRYPLRAKKLKDFCIWREAAELVYKIKKRPDDYRRVANALRHSKFTTEERLHFDNLFRELVNIRKYNSASTPVPTIPRARAKIEQQEVLLF